MVKVKNKSKASNNTIYKLVKILSKVKTNTPEAELNKVSMKDKKGIRIYF